MIQFSYRSDGKPTPQFNVSPEGSFAGGGGELWYPQIAFKNREIGMLKFTVPPGETAVSNGLLESTPDQKARGEFIFRISDPVKFAFAIGKYTVTHRAGKISFNLYLLRPRTHAQAMLDECAKVLNFLTNLFGKFPYREFSLVEVNFPTIVLGTSEFGLIFAHHSKLDDFDLSYWGHELGHQWWGIVVKSAPTTTGRMMLSEGVTQFGGLLGVEAAKGEAAADQFRRSGYRGKGQSAEYYFKLARAGTDFPLTSYLPKNQNETLTMHKLANSKGFILLDMLSRRIGRQRFAGILRRFVQQKTNQTTSWQEFQQAIEADAGQDIHWFFQQWFERTGAPDYQLTWNQTGKTVRGIVAQPAPYYRATLEIELRGPRRKLIKTIEVTNESKMFSWRVPFKVNSVVLDPHYRVLRWTPEFKADPSGPASSKKGQATKETEEQSTLIAGRLLGHNDQPMIKAHVHLSRFNQSKALTSVEVGKDGQFKLPTTESGLLQLRFSGVNHQSKRITVFVDKPMKIALNVRLQTYDYLKDFSEVKIIGDFNDFSFKSARAIDKRPDGTYVAEIKTQGEGFAYQLLGLTKDIGSVNGTQSEDYVYDGGGDYRSVLTPKNGHVTVTFDPRALVRSAAPGWVKFEDSTSFVARFVAIYDAMMTRREQLHDALVAYKKTSQPLNEFSYDWSSDVADLTHKISKEQQPLLRQALLFSYLDIGYGTHGAKLDVAIARRALVEIPPTSPLWSIEPWLIGVAIDTVGEPQSYSSYVKEIIERHSDPVVTRIVRNTLSSDRQIVVGKIAPAFTVAALDKPGITYSSESLKGKIVLIDFWATWCVPCVEEMPNLHQEYEKFKDQGFEILSVSLDEKPDLLNEFRKERWKMPWLHSLLASNPDLKKQFEIVGIPRAILIGRDGHIVATDKALRGRNLEQTLRRLVGAPQ